MAIGIKFCPTHLFEWPIELGKIDGVPDDAIVKYQVDCPNCNISGPARDTREEAEKAFLQYSCCRY